MYSLETVRRQPATFLSLTGLQTDEFDHLLAYFAPLWEHYHRHHDLKGKPRKLPKFKPAKNSTLPTEADKLFFVLAYLKNNALQTFTGFAFGLSQGKASQWLKVLLPLLEQSLAKAGQLPARTQEKLGASLQTAKEQVFFLDATERPIPKSTDEGRQRDDYSGKTHQHATKNTILTDTTGKVHYLGSSFEGRHHDKRILDQEPIALPKDSFLFQDLGYLGHRPDGVHIAMPDRKPKNKPLSDLQKAINTLINSFRVKVEHAICGIKRLRIVKDTIRLKGTAVRDQVFWLACGLHNLRIACRYANEKS